MPNWCYNEMTIDIQDDEEAIKQLKEFKESSIKTETIVKDDGTTYTDTKLTFEGVVPMPKSLRITSGSSVDDAIALIGARKGDLSGLNEIINREWTYKDSVWNNEPNKSKLYDKNTPKSEKVKIIQQYLEDKLDVNDMTEGELALENMEKYGVQDWYNWSIKFWGTKWDASTQDVDEHDERWIRIQFDTAWSPPEEWLQAVTTKYPLLNIMVRVTEESDAFMGYICCHNGKSNPSFASPEYI